MFHFEIRKGSTGARSVHNDRGVKLEEYVYMFEYVGCGGVAQARVGNCIHRACMCRRDIEEKTEDVSQSTTSTALAPSAMA